MASGMVQRPALEKLMDALVACAKSSALARIPFEQHPPPLFPVSSDSSESFCRGSMRDVFQQRLKNGQSHLRDRLRLHSYELSR